MYNLPSPPPWLMGNLVLEACACGHDYGVCHPVKQHHGLHDSSSHTFFSLVLLLTLYQLLWLVAAIILICLCHAHKSQLQRGQDQCMGRNQKRARGQEYGTVTFLMSLQKKGQINQ